MKYVFHFLKYSFLWQIKFFLLVLLSNIAVLSFFEQFPEFVSGLGILLFYLNGFYIFMSSYSLMSFSTQNSNMPSAFSGKYLFSLPLSKLRIILTIAISNLYTLIPAIIVIIWIKLKVENQKLFFDFQNFINQNFLTSIFALALLYFILIFYQIRVTIEEPRRSYNKGTFSNVLISIKGLTRFALIIMLFSLVTKEVILHNNITLLILFLIGNACAGLINCYRVLQNEELSFWNYKRDTFISLFYLFAIGFTLYNADLKDLNRMFNTKGWRYYYTSGDKIFLDIGDRKYRDIRSHIQTRVSLLKENPYGIKVVHALALLDFNKVEGLRKYFFEDKSLLSVPIKSKLKECNRQIQCGGITPFHLLAVEGRTKDLKYAIKNYPDGVFLKTDFNETPLHLASTYCSYKKIEILLNGMSDISARNKFQETPLMNAVTNNCIATAIILIKNGADINATNKEGQTAINLAEIYKRRKLQYLLEIFK